MITAKEAREGTKINNVPLTMTKLELALEYLDFLIHKKMEQGTYGLLIHNECDNLGQINPSYMAQMEKAIPDLKILDFDFMGEFHSWGKRVEYLFDYNIKPLVLMKLQNLGYKVAYIEGVPNEYACVPTYDELRISWGEV